ncbi:MAG: hypothetical protein J6P64_08445, partial [Bacteroidales bacterium]|nr:hypothetical protein [Bacteroidales bacterium]
LGILGSLPFRLLFIGSLLSKNLQPPSLSIADAKVHTFLFHATLFLKKFLIIFCALKINSLQGKNFPRGTKISLEAGF